MQSILALLAPAEAGAVTPASKMGYLSSTASIYSMAAKSSSSFLMAAEVMLSFAMADYWALAATSSIKGEFYEEITSFSFLSGEPWYSFPSFYGLELAAVAAAGGWSGLGEPASGPADGIW